MHSSFKGASANCRIYYGPAPAMTYPDPKEMTRETVVPVAEEKRLGRMVEQIAPMPIQNIPPDQFGLDEVDRAELRRMEPNAVREFMPYIRRESDRMESEGNILDVYKRQAHTFRAFFFGRVDIAHYSSFPNVPIRSCPGGRNRVNRIHSREFPSKARIGWGLGAIGEEER